MHCKIFSWLKSTPLGSPVVPLVYMIVDISVPVGGSGSIGFFFPWKTSNIVGEQCREIKIGPKKSAIIETIETNADFRLGPTFGT